MGEPLSLTSKAKETSYHPHYPDPTLLGIEDYFAYFVKHLCSFLFKFCLICFLRAFVLFLCNLEQLCLNFNFSRKRRRISNCYFFYNIKQRGQIIRFLLEVRGLRSRSL